MLSKEVLEYLETNKEKYLEKLFELLRFASVANDKSQPDQCQLCVDWLCNYLTTLGFETQILPAGEKPSVLATMHVSDDAPTLLIYGHYDVQPVEPLELWNSKPFEPVIKDGNIYARGANDDKGQLFTHIMAIDALHNWGILPVNIKFFIEGMEEIGSPGLEEFLATANNTQLLQADAAVISDSEFFADGLPSITYSLRGLAYGEITLTGPNQDVHSGIHGGALTNPINALTTLIAKMHDENGRVTLPGFYDDVIELTESEHDEWKKLPFNESEYAKSLGVDALGGGEKNFSVLERRWARPTLDCNGIIGGHTGEGAKTIIPEKASAKISMRLVPNQDPEKIAAGLEEFINQNVTAGIKASFKIQAKARPGLLEKDSPVMGAAIKAYLEGFGKEPAFIRCGASVPITELFQRLLGLEAVLMGFGLPDDNLHGPNEKFRLDQLYRGAKTSAAFMQNVKEAF